MSFNLDVPGWGGGQFKLPKGLIGGAFGLIGGGAIVRQDEAFAFPDDGADPPFGPHYDAHLRPLLSEFEGKRVEALRSCRTRMRGAVVLAGLAGGLGVVGALASGKPILLFLAGLIMFAGLAWAVWPVVSYGHELKDRVYPEVFRFFGEDFVYVRKGRLSASELRRSKILPSYDKEFVEDYVGGTYKGVGLELTECKLTEQQGSGDNRRDVTKFQGVFVLLQMHKNFSGRTVVKKDQGAIGNWFSGLGDGMDPVKLEDPRFEKRFDVVSTDQIEARYLLTPTFMERLMALPGLFNGTDVQASFFDNKLLLMIPCKHDRFEPGSVFAPTTFVPEIRTILEEMKVIFDMVELLKLHEDTGL